MSFLDNNQKKLFEALRISMDSPLERAEVLDRVKFRLDDLGFGEPGETEVMKVLERFEFKFEVKSQVDKAKSLHHFKNKAMEMCAISREQKRAVINILWFLRHLSCDPLNSKYDAFQPAELVFGDQTHTSQSQSDFTPTVTKNYKTALVPSSAFYGSESSLSSWSSDDDEETAAPNIGPNIPEVDVKSTNVDDVKGLEWTERPPYVNTMCARQYWKSNNRYYGQDNSITLTQIEAVSEILWCLCGVEKLVLFETNSHSGYVTLNPLCRIRNVSWVRLHELLQCICESAFAIRKLWNFANCYSGNFRIMQALQAWTASFLGEWTKDVKSNCFKTISQVVQLTSSKRERLLELFAVLKDAVSAPIVDYITLQDILQSAFRAADLVSARNSNMNGLLFDLCLTLIKPYLDITENLLRTGSLNDFTDEFFLSTMPGNKLGFSERLCKCEIFSTLSSDLALAGRSIRLIYKMSSNAYNGYDLSVGQLVQEVKSKLYEHKEWDFLLFQHVIDDSIRSRCHLATRALMSTLANRCYLDAIFRQFRDVYSLSVLDEFCRQIFQKNYRMGSDFMCSAFMESLSVHRWSTEEALKWKLSINSEHKDNIFDVISDIKFIPKIGWPLNFLINDNQLNDYNKVSHLLLSLSMSQLTLVHVNLTSCLDFGLLLLRFHLLHVINSVLGYFSALIYCGLQQYGAVCSANNINEALSCHNRLVENLLYSCFLTNDEHVVHKTILKLIELSKKISVVWNIPKEKHSAYGFSQIDAFQSCKKCCRLLQTILRIPLI